MADKLANSVFDGFYISGLKELDPEIVLTNIQTSPYFLSFQLLSVYPNQKLSKSMKVIHKWCFPVGLKIIQTNDPKFNKIEEYFQSEDDKLSSLVSEMNYFVVTDLVSMTKNYCTSAYFYEKIYLLDNINHRPEKLIELWVPKCYCISSRIPIFSAQRSFLLHLLSVHKMKQNIKQDKQIETQGQYKSYQIEQSRLNEFYYQLAMQVSQYKSDDEIYQIKLNNQEVWFSYYIRNNEKQPMTTILSPSNNAFDTVVFNQSPYNLMKLLLYMMHEYQIIFLAKRSGYVTIFCENLFDLLLPLQWKGIHIPFLVNNHFDFENTNIPYIIGLEKGKYAVPKKFDSEIKKRVIFDLEEGNFLLTSGEPNIPTHYQSYLIKKLNEVISDLKFWEEEYFEEGVLKYKQHLYNFNLLMFHDLLHYFGKSGNNSQQDQNNPQQQKKKVAYFNYKAYIEGFSPENREFFQILTKTQIFQHFIKECFKAIDYKQEYINSMKKKSADYSFLSVFQFILDVNFLSKRITKEETLEKRLKDLEEIQNQLIQDIVEKRVYDLVEKNLMDYLPEYLDNMKGNQSTDYISKIQTGQHIDDFITSNRESNILINKIDEKENNQDQSIDSATVISSKRYIDNNRKHIKNLNLFHKKYSLLLRNQEEYLDEESKENQSNHGSSIITNNRYRQSGSDLVSIDLQSTISNNKLGKYLPRKSSYRSPQQSPLNVSFQRSVHNNNKSMYSLWPVIGEDSQMEDKGEREDRDTNTMNKTIKESTLDLNQN